MNTLLRIAEEHKKGKQIGIYSVCSSHPLVIEASLRHTLKVNEIVLIESTSNQVNQDGGYTGLQPKDFRDRVYDLAKRVGFPLQNIILGGDHLGPNCWQNLSAQEAMDKSDVLIKDYVEAGFKKIHLDCSMSCADDPTPLSDEVVAERAARLCAVSEAAWRKTGGEAPVYIIGTEVPVPGGANEDLDDLEVTSVDAAGKTLEIHKQAFSARGLEQAWQRVIGLVVQPGVEFDHHKVVSFKPSEASELSQFIESEPRILFEAHSTDYQSADNLAALVKGHFAILKVGPWLTFAMREAFWALDQIESDWIPEEQQAGVKTAILKAMEENPNYWHKYYNDEQRKKIDCQYSLSDRIRYYWPVPEVDSAISKLIANLDDNPPPMTLISQYMPNQYAAISTQKISGNTLELIFHKISEVLGQYSAACSPNNSPI